jgi:hypothetical protein
VDHQDVVGGGGLEEVVIGILWAVAVLGVDELVGFKVDVIIIPGDGAAPFAGGVGMNALHGAGLAGVAIGQCGRLGVKMAAAPFIASSAGVGDIEHGVGVVGGCQLSTDPHGFCIAGRD